MKRRDLGVRIFAEVMAFSMVVGLCSPASAVFAAEGNDMAIVEEAAGQTSDAYGRAAEDGYVYCYAALTYKEYYENEEVYAGDSDASSSMADSRGELDKGAFDAVSRATTNHGLHRGNFQGDITIYDTEGSTYVMSHWDGQNTIVLADGSRITFNRGTITKEDGSTAVMANYQATGIKYVPVKVRSEDFADFSTRYRVVENGGTLAGGFSEVNLSSYSVSAEVDASTNGLKEAVKKADGTYSFGKRQTGTSSGIQGEGLKSIGQEALGVAVQDMSAYGDFLRVDFKGDYGDIGAKMQAVVWEYYGDGEQVLARYGTKFAADNWMHKSNGVQLGLTDSLRCQLPEGTDGTGKWKVTVYALGYADTTVELQVGPDAIRVPKPASDIGALRDIVAQARALSKDIYRAKSWAAMETERAEAEEILDAIDKGDTSVTQDTVDEAVAHLTDAIDGLEKMYVLMNIPYDDFYKAEIKNDVQVDAFTSATLNKSRTNSSAMAEGSYHVDPKGSDITGITYPVKVGDDVSLEGYKKVGETDSVDITVTNRGQTSTTTYTGADALFENPSYSYYELDEIPAYYKEVSVGADGSLSFGKDMSTRSAVDGVGTKFMTDTGYGDYQMNLDGLDLTGTKVFGVVLETKEGNGYGLRHVENIWRQTQLAWCTGFTEKVHNCPTSSEHYARMMGETIQKVVYYTSKGIMEIPVAEYVPVKFSKDTYTLKVSNAPVTAGETAFELSGLPQGYEARYSVDGLAVDISGSTLRFRAANAGGQVAKGRYTLTVEDGKGHYAPLIATFELYTEDMPAVYDPVKKALVAAEGSTMATVTGDYIKNITSVAVDGTEYAASGRGAVVIINEDGTVKTDAEPLAGKESCAIKITATGYLPLEFTYRAKTDINTTALSKAIQAAEKLKKADYTAASWKTVETALKAAKDTLSNAATQAQADVAAKKLNDAVKALKKAKPGTGTVYTYKNVKYQVIGSAAVKVQKAAKRSITSANVPAEVTIDGHKFKVTAVGASAFSGCKKLKKVSLGSNVATIGDKAFANCTALTNFTAASTKLSRIGKNAFSGDSRLASITLKTSRLTKAKVGANAFKKIKATCTFKVPSKKVSAYKAIFKGKGAGKKIKVKKL